jgi:hypothetical protein
MFRRKKGKYQKEISKVGWLFIVGVLVELISWSLSFLLYVLYGLVVDMVF